MRNGTKRSWRLKTDATSIENYLLPLGEARLFEKPLAAAAWEGAGGLKRAAEGGGNQKSNELGVG